MVSLMEIENKDGEEVLHMNVYELAGIVAAVAIVGFLMSRACYRKPAPTVPSEKVLLQLSDEEKLNLSQLGKSGHDYVQF